MTNELFSGPVVVGGVIEKDGRFLLIQEAKKGKHYYGKWNIPAGRLDQGETILDGAKREIKEETGCDVELTGILQIANAPVPGIKNPNAKFIGIVFATKIITEHIQYDPAEIMDARWFTYEELLNMKDELRSYTWIIEAITNFREQRIADINLITIW